MSGYPATRGLTVPGTIDRILVDGRDITNLRGKRVPTPGFTLTVPFGYGSSDPIRLPQINGYYEILGVGDLAFARKGVRVEYQRCERLPDGTAGPVVATDYIGRVWYVGVDAAVPFLVVEGDLIGDASHVYRPPPLRWRSIDGGTLLFALIERELQKRYTPRVDPDGDGQRLGVLTGIRLVERGGMYVDELLREYVGLLQHRNGDTWTVVPATWGTDEYTVSLVDRETVHYSLYVDKARVVPNLVDGPVDNEWFGQCIRTDGALERNAKLPGIIPGRPPRYPLEDESPFGVGTTNADTANGSGITVLHNKLISVGYLAPAYQGETYTVFTEEAVRKFRTKNDLGTSGNMTLEVWNALYDVTVAGYSLSQARIHALVQGPAVDPWLYTENGSLRKANPKHDLTVPRAGRRLDFGPGFTKAEMIEWIEGEQARTAGPNWTGTLTMVPGTGAILGLHEQGDPTPDDSALVSLRDLRPNSNVWLANYQGGILVYNPTIVFGTDGGARLDLDTHHRDGMEVREIIRRNKDSLNSPQRQHRRETRRSKGTFDARQPWEAEYGQIFDDAPCPAGKYTVIPVPAGQSGTIERLYIATKDAPAAFYAAVFGRAPGGNYKALQAELNRRVPNPGAVDANGETAWSTDPALEDWFEDRSLRLVLGNARQPCGYGRRKHTNDEKQVTNAPIVGWTRSGGFDYATFEEPVLYLCIWPQTDTVVEARRVMWKLYEDTA